MKNLTIFFLAIGSLLFISSCTDSINPASFDEAAEIVGSSLASNDGGATNFIESSVVISGEESSLLKTAFNQTTLVDSTVTATLTSGAKSWDYTWSYSVKANWEGAIPASLESSHTYTGSFDGPLISSTHSGNGNSVYTELGTWDTNQQKFVIKNNWIMNGTYKRTGTTVRKLTKKTMNSTTHIIFSDVILDRVNKKIQSGTAYIDIIGSVPQKGDFSYTGTLTFTGNGIATLDIDGLLYTVTLETGEVVIAN